MENISTYGLVGYPLGHSLSPFMHNAAFNALEVEAVYELFSMQERQLEQFFNDIKEANSPIFGLNVTVPYKEIALKYIDNLTPFAEKVGAINTVVITPERKLIGYNTDGPGFMAHLEELKFDVCDKRISIIGAGGASRAVISALCMIVEKPRSICVFDIDKSKVDVLIDDLGKRFDVSIVKAVDSIDDLNVEVADLLINATPIGLKENDPCLIESELIHSDMMVYDLIYNPSETKLLKMARERGAKTSNGLGMLFYQGVLAFQHWADLELDQNVRNIMRRALEEGLN